MTTRCVHSCLLALILSSGPLCAGCGGGGSPATPAPSTVPQIAGTYTGPVVDTSTIPNGLAKTWSIKYTSTSQNLLTFVDCEGTLTFVQTGSAFSGSFIERGDYCPNVSGQVTGGVVQADRSVRFSLAGPASDPLGWTGFGHCTVVTAGTMDFTGTIGSDNTLDASFARDTLMQCPNEGTVTINVRVRGVRQ